MAYQNIAISSGHGLYVRGAAGNPGLDEVDCARELVDHLADELERRGIGVVTFHDDKSKNQSDNLNAIVNWHNKQTRDVDLSCHFNAYQQTTKPMGTEVLYVSQKDLAADLSEAIASVGFLNRGAKHRSDLKFLNSTNMPAVLLEICFVDSSVDTEIYLEQFDAITSRIAAVLAGEGEEIEEGEGEAIGLPPPETEAPLFYARGKCSYFGGPEDMGVSASEGLAFHYEINENNQHLFLPLVPKGTTGLARRLNAKGVHYLAVRWNYDITPKEMLASMDYVAMVRVPSTGMQLTAWPADWGPAGPESDHDTGRVADLSPALMADLEIETDDEVEIIFPYTGGD